MNLFYFIILWNPSRVRDYKPRPSRTNFVARIKNSWHTGWQNEVQAVKDFGILINVQLFATQLILATKTIPFGFFVRAMA